LVRDGQPRPARLGAAGAARARRADASGADIDDFDVADERAVRERIAGFRVRSSG
jgi:hypothetical protein